MISNNCYFHITEQVKFCHEWCPFLIPVWFLLNQVTRNRWIRKWKKIKFWLFLSLELSLTLRLFLFLSLKSPPPPPIFSLPHSLYPAPSSLIVSLSSPLSVEQGNERKSWSPPPPPPPPQCVYALSLVPHHSFRWTEKWKKIKVLVLCVCVCVCLSLSLSQMNREMKENQGSWFGVCHCVCVCALSLFPSLSFRWTEKWKKRYWFSVCVCVCDLLSLPPPPTHPKTIK